MAIATLLPLLTENSMVSASTITITPRPTGSASTGVEALRCPTAYVGDQWRTAVEYDANEVTYFVLASDITGVTPHHNWTVTDGSEVFLIRQTQKFPFHGADKTFWQLDCKKVLT